MLPLVLLPFAVALLTAAAGAARAEREWLDRQALAVMLGLTAAMGLVLFSWRDDEIGTGTVLAGSAFGAILMALLPLLGYYALGRALARHRIALAVTSVISLAPLAYYLIVAVLLSLEIVSCPPDAYECPV